MDAQHTQRLKEAMAHRQSGRLGMAAQIYKDLLDDNPDDIDALRDWAALATQAGNYGRAIGFLERVLKLAPERIEALLHLADLYIRLDLPWKTMAVCDAAKEIKADDDVKAGLYNKMGAALRMLKRSDEALAYYQKADTLRPSTEEKINIANAFLDLNQKDKAAAILEQALKTEPRNTMLHFMYGKVYTYTGSDPHIDEMEELLTDYAAPDFHRARLCMTLGDACHKLQDYQKAFEYYAEGNRILRGSFKNYSMDIEQRKFEQIKAVFKDKELLKDYHPQSFETRPIFIVGMPRSGTSLLEQMLAAHPDIGTAGETLHLQQIQERHGIHLKTFQADVNALDQTKLDALAKAYITSLRHYTQAPNIIEKLPWNFLYIGLIHTLYPGARIIHIRRDPRDTCLSIYRTWFSTPWPYMYDLTELGQYYRMYEDLMTFWDAQYPGFIHTVSYEDLVEQPEEKLKDILGFCGLPWNKACLAFHKSDKPVITASAQQVREPLYKSSIGSWKNYEPYVQDLIGTLQNEGKQQ